MSKCVTFDKAENRLSYVTHAFGYDLLNTILFADKVYSMFDFFRTSENNSKDYELC